MSELLKNAFQSLDELCVVKINTSIKKKLIEAVEDGEEGEEKANDIRGLFEDSKAYVLDRELPVGDGTYYLFFEGLNEGEACSVIFDEFKIDNIDEVLVELLDDGHDFLASIKPEDGVFTLDTPLEKVEEEARAALGERPGNGLDEYEEDDGESIDTVTEAKEDDTEVPDDFEGQMDFLADDEEEAIDGYDKVISKVDGNAKKQLTHIKDEEEAHKEFLGKLKDDPEAVYDHPEDEEEHKDEAGEGELSLHVYGIEYDLEGVEDEEAAELPAELDIKVKDISDEEELRKEIGSRLQDETNHIVVNFAFDVLDSDEPDKDIELKKEGGEEGEPAPEETPAAEEEHPVDEEVENKARGHARAKKDSKFFRVRNKGSESTDESLKESKEFDINDKQDAEEAKELLDKNEEDEHVEQIVDVSADSVDDLKQSYIGSIGLQCPVCGTIRYADRDKLEKSENDIDQTSGKPLYNVGEACTHCGSDSGYIVIGQIAAVDVDPEANPDADLDTSVPEETPEEAPVEETPAEEVPAEGEEATLDLETGEVTPAEEEGESRRPQLIGDEEEPEEEKKEESLQYKDVEAKELDEGKFDMLITKYLRENYSNVSGYETTSGSIDENENKVVLEGKIKFNSGKERATKFIFEAKEITKKGKIKLFGLNETFSNKKAFGLTCELSGTKLLSESLTYRYSENDKVIKGRVEGPKKI